MAAMALVGCSSEQASRTVEACEVLAMEMPQLHPWASAGRKTADATDVAAGLRQVLELIDDENMSAMVYVHAGTDDRVLDQLADEIADVEGVVLVVRTMDEAETMERFEELFADAQHMLDAVEPGALPSSVDVIVARARLDDVTTWAEARAEVREVRTAAGLGASEHLKVRSPVGPERAQLQGIAEALRTVGGDPDWAATSADAIELVLAEGSEATASMLDPAEPTTVTAAQIEDVDRACE